MAYSGNPKEYSVAVLYGGTSGERPVSLNSGSSCAKALEGLGFKVTLIDTADTQDLSRLITDEFDVAFIALHGRGGEDGTIQGFLETLGIPYTGSGILASAQAINKSKTKELYAQAGLPVADSVTVGKGDPLNDDDLAGIMDEIGIPCVVKPATEGSSLGMTIVKDPADMRGAIDTALGVDDEAMVEQFIEGLELTVGVMGNDEPQALPVIQIVPTEDEFYNFHAKYAAGGSTHLCPAPISAELTEQLQNLAVAAHMVLGCKGVTRTDILVKDDGSCWILETNTLPGMTGTSLVPDAARAIGIEFPELCEKIVAMALE
ncbi:MAG: D-alanine--D-alanine ligase [Eggerthellales bacterium]|nr:D-alanine--D-alanine ligase [Eggerthellales bacterium]